MASLCSVRQETSEIVGAAVGLFNARLVDSSREPETRLIATRLINRGNLSDNEPSRES